MIDLNITLFIQIAHFVLAYFLLRTFLWKPIVRYLHDEEQHRIALDDELCKQRVIVEQKEFDLVGVRTQAHQAFARRIPPLITTESRVHVSLERANIPVPTFSSEHLDHIVEKIVEKVSQ